MEWFNPRSPRAAADLGAGRKGLIIDDALLDPDRVVDWARTHASDFRAVDFSKYPGTWLDPPPGLADALVDAFQQRARREFDARRLIESHVRLSLVTLPPQRLRPRQWLCHVDNFYATAGESMVACVLYLYRDERLGGTGFYEPARPAQEIDALWQGADTLEPDAFRARFGVEPGYLHASNPWFRRTGGIAPRWNRLVFYDGGTPHAAEISEPERLSGDPTLGRLTLNGFFTCRRHLV